MGLRSPFGYVGYVASFTRTFTDLIGGYCNNCHTDTDYQKGCRECPIGQLLYALREYLLDANEDYYGEREAKIAKEIKEVIKKIEPHPGYGWGVMNQGEESIAERTLREELKRLQKEL